MKKEKNESLQEIVKKHVFYVPSRLVELTEHLDLKTQIQYAHICNMVLFKMTENSDEHLINHDFVEIPRQAFAAIAKYDYPGLVRQLVEWNLLAVDDTYFQAPDKTSSKCKGYMLKETDDLTIITFPRRQTRKMTQKEFQTEIQKHVLESINKLTVDSNFEEEQDPIARFKQRISYQAVIEGNCSAEYGSGDDTHRLFNSVITMKRSWRKWLRHRANLNLVELDISNCFGWLLLTMIEDEQERQNFSVALEQDLYQALADDCFGGDRAKAKKEFLVFLSSKPSWSNKTIKWFASHFPALTAMVLGWSAAHKDSLNLTLQRMETDLMLYRVGARILEGDYFFINEHDGALVLKRNAHTVADIIREEWKRTYGFVPNITMTPLEAI